MKKFKLSKDLFHDAAGLSCIENYVLYAMATEGYPYPYLYYKSYLPLSGIITEFMGGKKYESFYTIERLQQVAVENHLIRTYRYETVGFDRLDSHDFNCIMVRPEYIQKKYGSSLLRDDHYILLGPGKAANTYTYVNDTPRDIGVITVSELRDISAGKMFCFDIQRAPDEVQKKKFLKYFYDAISLHSESQIDSSSIDITMARDSLGIYKIVSRRLIDFCSFYLSMDFYHPHLVQIERQYMMLEYMRLLGEKDLHRAQDLLKQLCMDNNQYIKILTCKMEEVL